MNLRVASKLLLILILQLLLLLFVTAKVDFIYAHF
jgi:hypothetical protein